MARQMVSRFARLGDECDEKSLSGGGITARNSDEEHGLKSGLMESSGERDSGSSHPGGDEGTGEDEQTWRNQEEVG